MVALKDAGGPKALEWWAKRQERSRRYSEENREKIREYSKRYNEENKERENLNLRKYYERMKAFLEKRSAVYGNRRK